MRTEGTSHEHRAASVIPAIVCNQPDDVAAVEIAGKYQIRVSFQDGTTGLVDMTQLVQSPQAGVFAELRDEAAFRTARVELGAVTWANGLDLAPDAMYAAFRDHGEWVLV